MLLLRYKSTWKRFRKSITAKLTFFYIITSLNLENTLVFNVFEDKEQFWELWVTPKILWHVFFRGYIILPQIKY